MFKEKYSQDKPLFENILSTPVISVQSKSSSGKTMFAENSPLAKYSFRTTGLNYDSKVSDKNQGCFLLNFIYFHYQL